MMSASGRAHELRERLRKERKAAKRAAKEARARERAALVLNSVEKCVSLGAAYSLLRA